MPRPTLARLATGAFLLLVGCEAALTIAGADASDAGGTLDAGTAGADARAETPDGQSGEVDAPADPSDASDASAPIPELMITCGDGGLELDPTFGDGGVVLPPPPPKPYQFYPMQTRFVVQRTDGTYVVAANTPGNYYIFVRQLLRYDVSGALVDAVPAWTGGNDRCYPGVDSFHVTESGRISGYSPIRGASITDGGPGNVGRNWIQYHWDGGLPEESRATRVLELSGEELLVAGSAETSPIDFTYCYPPNASSRTVYLGRVGADGTVAWKTKVFTGPSLVATAIELRDGQISVLVEGVRVARLSMSGELLWTSPTTTTSIVALDQGRVATAEGTLLADGGPEMTWDASVGPPRFVDDAGSVYFGSPPGLLHRRFADGGLDPSYASAPPTRLNLAEGPVWKGCTVTRTEDGALKRYRY